MTRITSSRPRPRRKLMILYIALLLVATGAICALHTCSLRKEGEGSLRVSGPSGGDTIDVALVYGPASYFIYADTLGGYNYDLLRLISRTEGVPMKFSPVGSLREALRQLRSGRYDMLASLPVDAAYRDKVLYSAPIYLDRQVLVQRKDAQGRVSASSALDLAGDTVHIEQDSPIAARLANLSHEIGDTIHVAEHPELSAELLVLKVQSGALRYAVVNEQTALPLVEKFPELDISSPISFTQFQSIVVAPGDSALLRRLDSWLDRRLGTPEAAELRRRYRLSK